MQTDITDERAAQLKAEAITLQRAARPAWRNEHLDRLARERNARRVTREYRPAQGEAESTKRCTKCHQTLPLEAFRVRRKTGVREARCNPCLSEEARAAYYKRIGQPNSGGARGTISPARRRKAVERIARLAAQLNGTGPLERINSEDDWHMAASELRKLWLQSGDKECVLCMATVPPTAMLPPGPGNFYTGKCQSCAAKEYRESCLRAGYGEPEGLLTIHLKDGSTITVSELARRHRQRELERTASRQGHRRF